MSELPVVMLVPDAHGEVERAAQRLREAGLRNPMVHLRSLDDLAPWRRQHPWEIAFLIVPAESCSEYLAGDAARPLPSYPVFALHSIGGRLMASVWSSPGAGAASPVPFDARGVVRSLHKLGLRWLVI